MVLVVLTPIKVKFGFVAPYVIMIHPDVTVGRSGTHRKVVEDRQVTSRPLLQVEACSGQEIAVFPAKTLDFSKPSPF